MANWKEQFINECKTIAKISGMEINPSQINKDLKGKKVADAYDMPIEWEVMLGDGSGAIVELSIIEIGQAIYRNATEVSEE